MSLKRRILSPIVAITVVGLAVAAGVGTTAKMALDDQSALFNDVLASVIYADRIDETLRAAKAKVDFVVSMTRLTEMEPVRAEFERDAAEVTRNIESVSRIAGSERMREASTALRAAFDAWIADARIVLGGAASREVPTQELLDRRAAAIASASGSIKDTAHADATSLARESARTLLWILAAAAALGIAAMTTALFFAIRSARSLSASVIGVAERLRVMAKADGEALGASGVRDEIGMMQSALAVLQGSLDEREALAEREKVEQEARRRRAEVADAFQARLAAVVDAARNGDLTQRLATDGLEADLRAVAERVNVLLSGTGAAIAAVSDVMRGFASGDLSVRMHGAFHGAFAALQTDTNATAETLNGLVQEIGGSVEALRASLRSLTGGAQSLASRAATQAASLDETKTTVEALTASVRVNATAADAARAISLQATTIAASGEKASTEAIDSIRLVDARSAQISEITSLVDGIAFQTNLLALNAAVEAARAGEAGKGFAVVATEVRSLAQRAADASREIKKLVADSSALISQTVTGVEATGAYLKEIRSSIELVAEKVVDISRGSQTQIGNIDELCASISIVDRETKQNENLSIETSSTSAEMMANADGLADLVAFFEARRPTGLRRAA